MPKKFCRVCDGEVNEINYCKTCKAFVETYESNRNYYVNERHGESGIPHDCEYHGTSQSSSYRDPQPNIPRQRRIERTSSPEWDEMQQRRFQEQQGDVHKVAKGIKIFVILWIVIVFAIMIISMASFFGIFHDAKNRVPDVDDWHEDISVDWDDDWDEDWDDLPFDMEDFQ